MPYGMTASAGIVATIAYSALNAVAQGPTIPALPPLLPPAQSVGTALPSGSAADANASARSLLVKARAALSEGKNAAAAQAFAQASLAAQQSPEMASELQQTRQQFVERGLSQQTLDQAMRVAQTGPGLTSQAANALRNKASANNNTVNNNPANSQSPLGNAISNIPSTLPTADWREPALPPTTVSAMVAAMPTSNGQPFKLPPAMPSAMPPTANQPSGPANPLRDQAVGLAAEAKMALDRGDTARARQLIQKANSLRVQDSEFGPGQLKPWDVALQVDRAERLRGGASTGVTTAGASLPAEGVQNAAGQSSPFGSGTSVQPSIYQPQTDMSRVAPASGVLSQYDAGTPAANGPDANTTGEELYQKGIAALSAGKKDAALRFFKSAWQKEADLDPGLRMQLKDKLTQLQISGGAPESIGALSAEGRENQGKRQKWFAEVSGEIADAEKMAQANKPLEALDKLKALRQRVSQAEVDGAQRKNLLAMVDRVASHMQEWAEQNKSMIQLDQRNKQIEDRIRLEAATLSKNDLQVQTLVDQYNDLTQAGRYAEAEEVSKKVREIMPDSEIAAVLYGKAKIQRRVEEQLAIKEKKEENWVDHFNSIESASTPYDGETALTWPTATEWIKLTKNRMAKDDIRMLPAEKKIRETLGQPFSASFDRRPLADAMNTISEMTGIPIIIDDLSIRTEGITIDQPVSLELKGNSIQLKSALNLILSQLNLKYVIKNEVLTIESIRNSKQDQITRTYNVKDLVIPIPNFVSDYNSGMAGALQSAYQAQTHMASANVPDPNVAGVAASRIASVDPSSSVLAQMNAMSGLSGMSPGALAGSMAVSQPYNPTGLGGAAMANYQELIGLIENTISPDNWLAAGGNSTMREFRQNLSLVVSAPQETHEAIANLLKSLRALQNLQVTIEVRFIQLSDTFFERIGLDFDFNIRDKLNRVTPPSRQPGSPSVAVGLSSGVGSTGPAFTSDLDFQVRNNFGVTPPFGNPDTGDAGTQVGLAILSDLELFFFLQAVQGNSRTNVLNAPKVTMFDGQTATITDQSQRPFVVSFEPVVGDFAVAQRPIVVVLNEGTQMNVQSVVSQDKRYVRLTLVPNFTRIESADRQFTFQGRRSTQTGTSILNPNSTQNLVNNNADIIEGTTVQQPTLGTTNVQTTVSVPDGGTILLGGIKRLREGRTERGTPILSKIPYLNRLFKNNAIGRETNTLMMTVTPRIIIPEEEEEALGVSIRP